MKQRKICLKSTRASWSRLCFHWCLRLVNWTQVENELKTKRHQYKCWEWQSIKLRVASILNTLRKLCECYRTTSCIESWIPAQSFSSGEYLIKQKEKTCKKSNRKEKRIEKAHELEHKYKLIAHHQMGIYVTRKLLNLWPLKLNQITRQLSRTFFFIY